MHRQNLGCTKLLKALVRLGERSRRWLARCDLRRVTIRPEAIERVGIEVNTLQIVDTIDLHRHRHNLYAVALSDECWKLTVRVDDDSDHRRQDRSQSTLGVEVRANVAAMFTRHREIS